MKQTRLIYVLTSAWFLGMSLASCGGDDNDGPTPPNTPPTIVPDTPPKNDNPEIDLYDICCINQQVILNGQTMYNRFPDLDQFNSWWNSDKASWERNNYKTSADFVSGVSSFFMLNPKNNKNWISVWLTVNNVRLFETQMKGDVILDFRDLYDDEGRVASPKTLHKNQKLKLSDYIYVLNHGGHSWNSISYFCELQSGNIFFKSYDAETGVMTIEFDNLSLKEKEWQFQPLNREPYKNVISGTVSLIYAEKDLL